MAERTQSILAEVAAERENQDATWGEQNHSPEVWLMILGEEVGEANRSALQAWVAGRHDGKRSGWRRLLHEYRAELIQVAAVSIAMIESLDRNELAEPKPEKPRRRLSGGDPMSHGGG